jgi:hypothetical protein
MSLRDVKISVRNKEWLGFADDVSFHIESYTIPQYGDKGEDIASDYDLEDCVRNMKRYLARAGKNSRPGQEQLDLIKIAHYAQMAYTIIGEQNAKEQ